MSLVTQMLVAEKYGLRLSTKQLAEALCMSVGTINNQCSAGTFPIPMYIDGKTRWADYRSVAAYIDDLYERATEAANQRNQSSRFR